MKKIPIKVLFVELSKITLQRGQEIEIKITDYAFGGRGIGKIQTENGLFVVFVDNTFPRTDS